MTNNGAPINSGSSLVRRLVSSGRAERTTLPAVAGNAAVAEFCPSEENNNFDEPPAIEWAPEECEPDERPSGVVVAGSKYFARGDHVELAIELVRDLAPPGQLVFAESRLWRYVANAGRWQWVDDHETSRLVQSYAGSECGDGKSAGPLEVSSGTVAGTIKLATDRVAEPEGSPFFRESAVAFSNGVAVVDAGRLTFEPGRPELRARWGFDFALNPAAPPPPRFVGMLEGIFRDDADRAAKIDLVQEFFGACCLGIATRFGKCLVMYGPTAENGKSTLLTAMMRAMPSGRVTSIAPQDMSAEYARADLAGVHLNAVEELPERELLDSEAFKSIVTGGLIRARRIYGKPFEFQARAGHVFAANVLPTVADLTNGFWRRVLVLPFNRSFTNDPERQVGMLDAVLANELPAIVSWLVAGARRALERGAFTIPPSHDTAAAQWRRDANPVALFVAECTKPLEADQLPTVWGTAATALYDRFTMWCTRNGHKIMARNTFGIRMRLMGVESVHSEHGSRYPVTLLGGES